MKKLPESTAMATSCLLTHGMRELRREIPNISGITPPPPPFDVSSFAPPGVSIVNNMMMARFHRGPSALTYSWFYQQVRRHGPWDYKQRGKGFESFGNFHYGAVGHAAGISDEVLLRGAGWAQSQAGTSDPAFGDWYGSTPYGDDPDDQYWIRAGIDYAKRAGF